MDSLQGIVTNCQHTLQISGGGGSNRNNTSTTTTYIALFRVNNRAVEFRTNRPSSVSDGDQVAVAGTFTRSNSLWVYALRNVTTGETTNSGLWGSVFALVFLPIVLGFITFVAVGIFGRVALLGGSALIALVVVYFLRQIVLTQQAIDLVRN